MGLVICQASSPSEQANCAIMTMSNGHGGLQMKRKKRQIPAGEFKAKCLQLMDEIQRSRNELVITKHGKPVAKLVPYEEETPTLFGFMKDSVIIKGDIISSIDVDWEAQQS